MDLKDDYMDTLMQFVYFYPPSQMNPNNISAIGTNGTYGLLSINLDTALMFDNIVYMPTSTNTAQIFITPEAFTNWYQNNISQTLNNSNLSFIYKYLVNPVTLNGVTYSNVNDEVKAYLSNNGFYWVPYNPNYAVYYNVESAVIDPVKNYSFTSNNLYMLIRSEIIASTSSVSNQIYNNIAIETEQSQNTEAITNQENATTSLSQIITSSVVQTITNSENTLGQTLNGSNLTFDLIIGLVAILGIAGIAIMIK
ncbi:MAG: hypothetical protein ACP5U0_08090 [Caldisphaera sp.]